MSQLRRPAKGPLSSKKILQVVRLQVRKWLQDDRELHDDRGLVQLVERLLDTVRPTGDVKFKIRDKKTGLYSSGGYTPSWSESGKTWDKLSEIRAHLKMLERGSRYCPSMKVPASWEIVEFRLEFVGPVKSARSLLKPAASV
jgi:hypothetical protein